MRLFHRGWVLLVIALLFFLLTFESAYAWRPLTHYYINEEAASGRYIKYYDSYCENGMSPDMFTSWIYVTTSPWVDSAHSPDLRKDEQDIYAYRGEPNFAYLMLKVRGQGHPESRYYASALGWGSHIAADWVD